MGTCHREVETIKNKTLDLKSTITKISKNVLDECKSRPDRAKNQELEYRITKIIHSK